MTALNQIVNLIENYDIPKLFKAVKQEQDKRESLKRQELARNDLLAFTQYTYFKYKADRVHRLICIYLNKVVRQEIRKLIITAPPQHGKSELVSVRLPAYWLAHNPNLPVILTSYGADLARTKSRECRNLVDSPAYKLLFPNITIDSSARTVKNWHLQGYNGFLLASGVGGPITGAGAGLGVIDDPLENWEQAQSPTQRKKIWDWYKGVFRTRLWENSCQVIIMTRWHEDDLIGYLINEQKDWTILRLPAIEESQDVRDRNNALYNLPPGLSDPLGRRKGQALAPSRFNLKTLAEIKKDVGSIVWSTAYQCAPMDVEGNRFKRSWFKILDKLPGVEIESRARYWDFAATEGAGCRTAGVKLSIDVDGNIYIEDVKFGQWSTEKRNKIIRQTCMADDIQHRNNGYMVFEQEPGSAGVDAKKSVIKYLAGYAVKSDKVTGSKDTRLEPFAAQAEAGNVHLIRGDWNNTYIDELSLIPNGKFRDMADATAGAYNHLTRNLISFGKI